MQPPGPVDCPSCDFCSSPPRPHRRLARVSFPSIQPAWPPTLRLLVPLRPRPPPFILILLLIGSASPEADHGPISTGIRYFVQANTVGQLLKPLSRFREPFCRGRVASLRRLYLAPSSQTAQPCGCLHSRDHWTALLQCIFIPTPS